MTIHASIAAAHAATSPKKRRAPARKTTKEASLSKAERRAETTEQILDEAEYLFSRHGLYGVTLKDVAKRAGVHHTLVNYYFTDKDKLFNAVFERRAEVTRSLRMKALEEYEAANADNLTVEGALHTFLDTDLDLYGSGGEGWRNYGALASQVANTPEWGAKLMDKNFDPVVLKLIDIIIRALPESKQVRRFLGLSLRFRRTVTYFSEDRPDR